MRDLDHAGNLIIMARKDLTALCAMYDPTSFAIEVFGFHVQQAVEKALKALLCCAGVAYPRIHDLDELARLLQQANQELPEGSRDLLAFTDFAVAFRYEGFPDIDAEVDRPATVLRVTRLIEHVEKTIRRSSAGP